VNEGQIEYTYYDEKGKAGNYINVSNLKLIKENNVYYLGDGTQLKPLAYKDDSLIVLSDYGRGPGLYNLFLISKNDFDKLSFR